VSPVGRPKRILDEFELIYFLELSRYISEEDVSRLLKVIRAAKDPLLTPILDLLEIYQLKRIDISLRLREDNARKQWYH
jgi:hypothetical protein